MKPGQTDTSLSHEHLLYRLNYDPETGVFTWNHPNTKGGKAKPGEVAGTVNSYGYIEITFDRRRYRAHRLAWFYVYKRWPEDCLDHINHVHTDNRINNLREASHSVNSQNRPRVSSNTSGVTGVGYYEGLGKWRASISVSGRLIWLGDFNDREDAVDARDRANREYGFHPNHGI